MPATQFTAAETRIIRARNIAKLYAAHPDAAPVLDWAQSEGSKNSFVGAMMMKAIVKGQSLTAAHVDAIARIKGKES